MSLRRTLRLWGRNALDTVSGVRAKDHRRWLRTIAVVAVINGSVFMLGHVLYLAVLAHQPAMTGILWALAFLAFAGACVTSVLIAGGVLLLRRHPVAKKLLVTWATIQLINQTFWIGLLLMVYLDLPLHLQAKLAPQVKVTLFALGGIALYAVLMLIWMSRRFVRRELSRW
jgi:hypothetical protein